MIKALLFKTFTNSTLTKVAHYRALLYYHIDHMDDIEYKHLIFHDVMELDDD